MTGQPPRVHALDAGPFSPRDLEQLSHRGIGAEEAARQLALLAAPPPRRTLARPCVPGDGILRLGPRAIAAAAALHRQAAARGRVSLFVPASGAATRMFKDLLACAAGASRAELEGRRAAGDAAAREAVLFLERLDRFALKGALAAALAARGQDLGALLAEGRYGPVVDALLGDAGLRYAERPKGLIPFHAGPDGPLTPFEEHLIEAVPLARDARKLCRLHFTVAPGHEPDFRALRERARAGLERRLGTRHQVGFSAQAPSTDTLASTLDGQPFRDDSGALLFRPAGHGALIRNLAALEADLVFVKNIDNVAAAPFKAAGEGWSRVLVGWLAWVQRRSFELLRRLEDARDREAPADAMRFAATFGRGAAEGEGAAGRHAARALLARPIRVCGMVPNTGEPGGGPFWVRGRGGSVTAQIVESAEVDLDDAEQRAIFERSTHFNPVFMALGLRDERRRPFDLARFVDEGAVIVTRKTHGDRELLALERPGLWNGAMAGWNTVFVEVPLGVFTPVKTVNDLLRQEHQAERRRRERT